MKCAISVENPNFESLWRQLDFDHFIPENCMAKLKENNINLIPRQDVAIALK